MTQTGWQPDGSYTPCPECNWTPPPDDPDTPGVPIRLPGTTHKNTCSTIPRLSPEAERELHDRLIEMDRVRRRGAAEARNFWIG